MTVVPKEASTVSGEPRSQETKDSRRHTSSLVSNYMQVYKRSVLLLTASKFFVKIPAANVSSELYEFDPRRARIQVVHGYSRLGIKIEVFIIQPILMQLI